MATIICPFMRNEESITLQGEGLRTQRHGVFRATSDSEKSLTYHDIRLHETKAGIPFLPDYGSLFISSCSSKEIWRKK